MFKPCMQKNGKEKLSSRKWWFPRRSCNLKVGRRKNLQNLLLHFLCVFFFREESPWRVMVVLEVGYGTKGSNSGRLWIFCGEWGVVAAC